VILWFFGSVSLWGEREGMVTNVKKRVGEGCCGERKEERRREREERGSLCINF
jgi:hypothetical protein